MLDFYQQILPILLILFLSALVLFFSNFMINFFSKTVVTVLQKIFGIILGALSIQFIIDGIKESFL